MVSEQPLHQIIFFLCHIDISCKFQQHLSTALQVILQTNPHHKKKTKQKHNFLRGGHKATEIMQWNG